MRKREYYLTAVEAKALDKKALEKFGIPTLILMENAGRAIMEEALKNLKSSQSKIAVFCGKGNNGGDGFCAARHLLVKGFKPDVYLVCKINDVENEAKINLSMLLKMKQRIIQIDPRNLSFLRKRIGEYDLIIDALLGVGTKGPIRPAYQQVIDLINSLDRYVLSVDIPSGLDATTGEVRGRCIKADQTVTFVAKKLGMVRGMGRKYCGKVIARSIGLPEAFLF